MNTKPGRDICRYWMAAKKHCSIKDGKGQLHCLEFWLCTGATSVHDRFRNANICTGDSTHVGTDNSGRLACSRNCHVHRGEVDTGSRVERRNPSSRTSVNEDFPSNILRIPSPFAERIVPHLYSSGLSGHLTLVLRFSYKPHFNIYLYHDLLPLSFF